MLQQKANKQTKKQTKKTKAKTPLQLVKWCI